MFLRNQGVPLLDSNEKDGDSPELHGASLLRTIFVSLARTQARARAQHQKIPFKLSLTAK